MEVIVRDEVRLGQLAFNRLQVLSAIDVGHNVSMLKEQLREIEKSMVHLGWDGEPHLVRMVEGQPRLVKQEKPDGIVIAVKPFKAEGFMNKYK